MKRNLLIISTIFCILNYNYAIVADSAIYYLENFEENNLNEWTYEYVTQEWNWITSQGTGYEANPPFSAAEGNFNASFKRQDGTNNITKLISPEYSLSKADTAQLHFQLSQYYFDSPFGTGNSKLSVYYKSPALGNIWIKLKDFDDPINGWEEQIIPLPDTLTKIPFFNIAFEGRIGDNEHGTCIDNVYIKEVGSNPKQLDNITAIVASDDIIPTNSLNNPMLQLKFSTSGNLGTLTLDSLAVHSSLENNNVIPENGMKLYYTESSNFNDLTPIAQASFNDGQAIFTNIDFNLPFGNSYVWVTVDVNKDPNNAFKGVILDAMIHANNIRVNNNTTKPDKDLSPGVARAIRKSLFFDNFEHPEDSIWVTTGEFEISKPLGLNGNRGNPDPSFAYSGMNVLGSDLSGQGIYKGGYEKNLSEDEETATTDTLLDASYYKNMQFGFHKWLNSNANDNTSIQVSLDNGATWENIWSNDVFYLETRYNYDYADLKDITDRQNNLIFRFVVGPTANYSYSGWNIDNVSITGDFINFDAGVTKLITPTAGCGHTGPEPLTVTIQNFGYNTLDSIPVGYSLDGGSSWVVTDTMVTSMDRTTSSNFTFNELIDISSPGYYNLKIKTILESDEDPRNNLFDTTLFVSPTYTIPYSEDFENNYGYWKKGGENDTWEHGTPNANEINQAYSGINSWATNLSGNYQNNDSAWIESPCFDFTGIDKPIIDFRLWTKAEQDKDGLALYYTINDGATWTLVAKESSDYNWDWYNNGNIEALGTAGWDSVTNNWFYIRQVLPADIANVDIVKFRFLFQSNGSVVSEGFAIDDIRLYDAPTDAGVSAIVSPVNECTFTEEESITVAIKNYGIRTIKATDTLFTKILVNDETTLTDTFIVSSPIPVNGTANFTFNNKVDLRLKKWHTFEAYTQVKGDTNYYAATYNDTLVDSVYVTGEPLHKLPANIGTLNADTVIIDGGQHAATGTDFASYTWTYIQHTGSEPDTRTYDTPEFTPGEDIMDFAISIVNDSGCVHKDTMQVIKTQINIGISAISGISDACLDEQGQTLTVTVKNYSASYSLPDDTTITVGYRTNEHELIEEIHESFQLAAALAPGAEVQHMFTLAPNYTTDGTFKVEAFTAVKVDLDYSNDTATQSISIFPEPKVNLGADSVLTLKADELVLDAGTGNYSYLWQDNTTAQTFDINSKLNATYSVTVTSTDGCGTASDAVNIIADNWTLSEISQPITQCEPSAAEEVVIKLTNNSPNTYPIGFKIPAVIIIDNDTINENIELISELAPGAFTAYTFNSTLDLTNTKEYNMVVSINPSSDINRDDNKVQKYINIWGVYPIDLGADSIITKRADTILLDAGFHHDSYIWQDNSTNQTYKITSNESFKYLVTVTDINNCSNSQDSISIVSYDIGVNEIITPSSQCELTGTNTISINVQNFGKTIIPSLTKIPFSYRINNGNWTTIEHTLNSDLHINSSIDIYLYQVLVFESDQIYEMEVRSGWNRDHFHENDTATKIIYQYDSPTVDLGDDIYTLKADTVSLHAGDNHTTYKWNTGSRLKIIYVSNTATSDYAVTVTNNFGCSDNDALTVYTYDISIGSISGISHTCNAFKNDTAIIQIALHGTDTLFPNQKLNAEYSINGQIIDDQITLTDTLFPGQSYYHKFSDGFNLIESGTYDFNASISIDNEVDVTNNNFSTHVRVGTFPVSLEDDVFTYNDEYTLNAEGDSLTSYLWSNDNATINTTVESTGTYHVTATDKYACTSNDSIAVTFIMPEYEITEILGLGDSCLRENKQVFGFVMKNTGNDTIQSDSLISISYQVNDSLYNESFSMSTKFIPGSIDSLYFTEGIDLSAIKSHNISVSHSFFGGKTTTADTLVTTFGLPTIDLGDNIITYEDIITLDAGSGFADYEWNTGESTRKVEVSADSIYAVVVSTFNGCSNTDSIAVTFIKANYLIDSIYGLYDACPDSTLKIPSFKLNNTGNDTLQVGHKVAILATVSADNQEITDTFTLSEKLFPLESMKIPFTSGLAFDSTGSYTIVVQAKWTDFNLQSDTAIVIWSIPEPDLGINDNVQTDTLQLNPGEGFATYLWSTAATTPTITIDENGTYWVDVTNDNGCINRDSTKVRFDDVILQIGQFIAPDTTCGELLDFTPTISIKNAGTKPLLKESNLTISYHLSEVDTVAERVVLSSDLPGGVTIDYSFSQKITIDSAGIHPIEFKVWMNGILNDTAVYDIVIDSLPVFTFESDTIKTESYPITLDPQIENVDYEWSTEETSNTIDVNADGMYSLTVTNVQRCVYSDSVYTLLSGDTVGVMDNLWASQIQVYPNPATNMVFVELPDNHDAVRVIVSDASGKTIQTIEGVSEATQIRVDELEHGYYLIHIIGDNKRAVFRIMVE